MAAELKRELFAGFSPRASSALLRHDWPGNVRELKNAVERSVYRSADPDAVIARIAFDPFDSPFQLSGPSSNPFTKASTRQRPPLLPTDLKERLRDTEKSLVEAALDKARFNQKSA